MAYMEIQNMQLSFFNIYTNCTKLLLLLLTHTHTHTHTYIYIYIYIYAQWEEQH
jgi:hypothetical protein